MKAAKQHSLEAEKTKTSLWVHIFFLVFGLICIIPFMIIISASISGELDLAVNGFSVLPRKVDFSAYAYLFRNPKSIVDVSRSAVHVHGSLLPVPQHIPL